MVSVNVVIMSAGAGVRLNPFSLYWPKVLSPVANASLLYRLLAQLAAVGIDAAHLTLAPTALRSAEYVDAQVPPGFHLEIHFCTSRNMVQSVRDISVSDARPVLVIYGDSLISADFRALVDDHFRFRARGGLATILYHRPQDLLVSEKEGRT